MNIEIKNIRKVLSADIMLNGLTVLTGHNDIGKTTVAKTIFSLLGAPYYLKEYLHKDFNEKLRESLHEDFNKKLRESFRSGYIQNTRTPKLTSSVSIVKDHDRLTFAFKDEECQLIETADKYFNEFTTYINYNQLDSKHGEQFFLSNERDYSDLHVDIVEFINEISTIIGGTMFYKPMIQSFVLKVNDKYITDIQRSKQAFGILQMFCMYFSLSPNPVLILVEPETGLHPEWQLLYANLIIKLVKLGATVLITSNSPYLVEALSTYSKREDLESKTSFYVGESSDLGTVFQYEEQDLNRTFEFFAKPMRRLL